MDGNAGETPSWDEPDDRSEPSGSDRNAEEPPAGGNGSGDSKDAVRLILFLEVMALVGDEPTATAAGLVALILTYLRGL